AQPRKSSSFRVVYELSRELRLQLLPFVGEGMCNPSAERGLAGHDEDPVPAVAVRELRNLACLRLDLQTERVQVPRHQYVAVRNVECERGHAYNAAQCECRDAIAGEGPDHGARTARYGALVCGENLVGILRGGVHGYSEPVFLRQRRGGENAKAHRV